ncbi:uncharacterized protein TNCV_727571 [Trichonephila clavipes]|nr:uncharacterized protein TNCV_727571 [Trichonephila clavipes]
MDVCKCIVPLRQGCTLNSRRAANPLVRIMEREERWEAHGHCKGFLPLNWGETEKNRTVPCMVLKAKANDRRKNSSPKILRQAGCISRNNTKIVDYFPSSNLVERRFSSVRNLLTQKEKPTKN